MNEKQILIALTLGIPLVIITVCWGLLLSAMKNTTGELKLWIAPDILIKIIVIVFITSSVLSLAVLDILKGDIVATIFGGIIGYTLGANFQSKSNRTK